MDLKELFRLEGAMGPRLDTAASSERCSRERAGVRGPHIHAGPRSPYKDRCGGYSRRYRSEVAGVR